MTFMKLHRLTAPAVLFAAASLLSGCLTQDDGSGPIAAGSEEEAIQYVALEEMSAYVDPDVRFEDDGSDTQRGIETERWRRELLRFARTVSIDIEAPGGDVRPSANVVVRGQATGILHLAELQGDEWVRYAKDFDDSGVRSLYFEKVRRHTLRHRGWRLQAMSGVEIASEGTTRRIESVRIQAGDVDQTITNVSDLIDLDDILRLPAGQMVTVTVDTGDATDQVYLHLRHRFRRELHGNGDGTFTGAFETSADFRGPRHLVFDVLSNATLFDDVAPYDNVAWGYPFVLEGQNDRPDDANDAASDAS
jgi:hypothetical protein